MAGLSRAQKKQSSEFTEFSTKTNIFVDLLFLQIEWSELNTRNKLKSMTENRKQQHQQLTALIVEKKMEFERLRIHYESLLKDQEDQREFIEQFMQQK